MVYIYAIKLEKGKYYIGKTTHPQFRLQSHFDSNGSKWTNMIEHRKAQCSKGSNMFENRENKWLKRDKPV